MKIQIVCSLIGMLCGAPAQTQQAQSQDDTFTFAATWGTPCSRSGGMSDGEYQYKGADAGHGRCKWVVDQEATKDIQQAEAQYEKHRQDLLWALRSRPLTPQEMGEVEQMGLSLVTPNNVQYDENEKVRELNDDLLQQYRLQAAAHQADHNGKPP